MKKYLSLIFFTALSLNSRAQWTQHYTPVPAQLYSISFMNEQTGFTSGSSQQGSGFYRSTDGGITWDTLFLPLPCLIWSVQALDSTHLYAAGQTSPSGGLLLFSQDQGDTWITINPPTALYGLTDVEFAAGGLFGIAVDGNGNIFRTTDGGQSWSDTLIDQGFGVPYFFTRIEIADPLNIYLGGWDASFAYQGAILKSTDGGVNWSVINIPSNYTVIDAIDFLNADTGLAVTSSAGSNPARIFRTFDGGASWDTVVFNTGHFPTDVKFVDADKLFMTTDEGYIYTSTDAGLSWLIDFDADTALNALCVVDQTVWATGENGLTVKNDPGSDIGELMSDHFAVFPNPFNNELQIECNAGSGVLKIYSSNSSLIAEMPVHSFPFKTSLTLPSGMYLIAIHTELGEFRKIAVSVNND